MKNFKNQFVQLMLAFSITSFQSNAQSYFGGTGAGTSNSGSGITGLGVNAIHSGNSGLFNSAVGYAAMYQNKTGSDNTACGAFALQNNLGGQKNIAIGNYSLNFNSSGSSNSSFGYHALFSNTIGSNNTASGESALHSNISGYENTASGYRSLYANTGAQNTATGAHSLTSATSGSNNAAFGWGAGMLRAGLNNCTFVGASADATANNFTNATAIGYNAKVDGSNKVRIGGTAVTSIGGQVGWTTLSDVRLKENIKESALGLDFILNLRPVTYNYKTEGQSGILYTGLIAQEVDAAAKKQNVEFSGVDRNGEYWGIRYGELTIPLIKAVQDQQEIIKTLQSEIADLKNQSANSSSDKTSKTILSYQNKLEQNSPNPFSDKTTIRYSVSAYAVSAHIIIRSLNGVELKSILLDRKENGSVTIESSQLAQGTYTYTLEVDGKSVDTKLMVITK